MYVCMYGHHILYIARRVQVGKDQSGKVANPAPKSAEQGNEYITVHVRSRLIIWSGETVWVVPSRVSLHISILRLNLVLTYYGIPPEIHGGVHLYI